jgi:hypothetical protein
MFTFPFFIITFQILVCPQIWACISFVPENLVWLQFKDNLSSFFWHYSQIGTVTIQTTFFFTNYGNTKFERASMGQTKQAPVVIRLNLCMQVI